jgi:hypothetical protein
MSAAITTSMTLTGAAVIMFTAACSHDERARPISSHAEPAKQEQRTMTPQDSRTGKAQQFLEGNRPVLGRVEAVTSGQIKVDIGEVQPRFIPVKPAQEKHFADIQPGDDLIIVLNAENLLVDYHPLNQPGGPHRVIYGQIAQNLPIGQDTVVIKDDQGQEQSFQVRPLARSKLAAIQVGAPAMFLIDETSKVADATFASQHAAQRAQERPEHKSPIKGAHRQVDGTVSQPLHADRITIQTAEGERPFEVHQVVQEKLAKLGKGESVILLVDKEDKVIDVAIPPQR